MVNIQKKKISTMLPKRKNFLFALISLIFIQFVKGEIHENKHKLDAKNSIRNLDDVILYIEKNIKREMSETIQESNNEISEEEDEQFDSSFVYALPLDAKEKIAAKSGDVTALPWWKRGVIYQIYPKSFQDTSGDGVGDLPGIISRLDYFKYIGVEAIWLSPFYPSPQKDAGYDISDFYDVDHLFGTVHDFDRLVKEAHNRNLKVIADFVVGHLSTDGDWFKHSVKRRGKYTDYFIWSDGKQLANGTRVPPNNWLSVFGGSAWTWNAERGQFYYHAFLKEQATFNHRNPEVEEEMRMILRYWLDKGVDGFRVDAIPNIFVAKNLSLDEPRSGSGSPNEHWYLKHIYTESLPEVYKAVAFYNSVLQDYEKRDGKSRLMILEAYVGAKETEKYYATGAVPFNMGLTSIKGVSEWGTYLNSHVFGYLKSLPTGAWPNFVVGNHDVSRVSMKYGAEFCDVWNIMLLTLPGTAATYYGEELAIISPEISFNQTLDPQGIYYGPTGYMYHTRDYQRGPMQWDDSYMAGFTNGNETWLPIAKSYKTINVKTEKESTNQTSLQLYSKLTRLRQRPAFRFGTTAPALTNANVFSFIRQLNKDKYLVALNFGKSPSTDDYSTPLSDKLGKVVASTGPPKFADGASLPLSAITLESGEGIVLKISGDDRVG